MLIYLGVVYLFIILVSLFLFCSLDVHYRGQNLPLSWRLAGQAMWLDWVMISALRRQDCFLVALW